jgi:hypothetical protein
VALSLKEQRERDALRKEQKRAERMGVKTIATGEGLVAQLGKGRQISDGDLKRMEQAVAVFRDGGEELDRVVENLKLHQKAMYKMVQDELKGDWMGAFGRLVGAIPAARRFRPFAISWPEWRQIGLEAGMNEEEVVDALKVMLVFRDR